MHLYGILIGHICFYNIRKRFAVKELIYKSVKFNPKRIGAAFKCSFARFCPTFKTGNRCKIALRQPQNISDFTFFGRFYKSVSATFTLQSFDDTVFG